MVAYGKGKLPFVLRAAKVGCESKADVGHEGVRWPVGECHKLSGLHFMPAKSEKLQSVVRG
ncbi:hypothetical protein SAMN04487991_1579 [Celeribacter neptunius]|uniref:Uncharacterized protein n=1 Tax=Celeribacter neptunius TaxID=588602 RepID=A0A1I3P6S8_9RHOB|nr:hypothetical protein SAMN04487991_1579 [Celeribacter neptunius]